MTPTAPTPDTIESASTPSAESVLQCKIDELTSELQAARAEAQAAMHERDQLRGEIAGITARLPELQEKISTLTAERDFAVKNVERISQYAGVKGIDPSEAISIAGEDTTAGELLDRYSKLQGRERTEFFRRHKEAILRAGAFA